jgi:hypothetical protein
MQSILYQITEDVKLPGIVYSLQNWMRTTSAKAGRRGWLNGADKKTPWLHRVYCKEHMNDMFLAVCFPII